MNQETVLEKEIPTGKIYKERMVGVGSFLGGPLVAGYFIAENYKQFGETKKFKLTWIYTIAFTFLVFGGVMFAPFAERIPNNIVPIIYTVLAMILVQALQGQKLNKHIEKDGEIYSWWRVIGISIIGLIITISFFFGIGYMTTPSEITKSYGDLKNEITYIEGNVTETEANNLAEKFKKTGYFDDQIRTSAYLEKFGDKYVISIGLENEQSLNDEELEGFTLIRNDLQKEFPNNKIAINLVFNDITNIIKKIE